jgi:nucleoside-specific outer membrane channel protein Tsx
MPTLHVNPAAALLASAALALPLAACAEGFSTSNVQLLQGWSFHDNLLGYDTRSGAMTTVTLEHFAAWEYGDHFVFLDLYRGQFVNGTTLTGSTTDLYAEWHPRLFLSRLLGLSALGPLRNWGLAAEVNQARDFQAYLVGLGVDLALPGFALAGVNLYYRYQNVTVRYVDSAGTAAAANLYDHTWQLSPFWAVPFQVGPAGFLLAGFVDVSANRNRRLDVMAQPQLLLDLALLLGLPPGRLHAGVEWYLHSFQNPDPARNGTIKVVSLPQAMIRATVH